MKISWIKLRRCRIAILSPIGFKIYFFTHIFKKMKYINKFLSRKGLFLFRTENFNFIGNKVLGKV